MRRGGRWSACTSSRRAISPSASPTGAPPSPPLCCRTPKVRSTFLSSSSSSSISLEKNPSMHGSPSPAVPVRVRLVSPVRHHQRIYCSAAPTPFAGDLADVVLGYDTIGGYVVSSSITLLPFLLTQPLLVFLCFFAYLCNSFTNYCCLHNVVVSLRHVHSFLISSFRICAILFQFCK